MEGAQALHFHGERPVQEGLFEQTKPIQPLFSSSVGKRKTIPRGPRGWRYRVRRTDWLLHLQGEHSDSCWPARLALVNELEAIENRDNWVSLSLSRWR